MDGSNTTRNQKIILTSTCIAYSEMILLSYGNIHRIQTDLLASENRQAGKTLELAASKAATEKW